MPTDNDVKEETESQDFVKDETGDLGATPDRPEFGTQTIPDDAAVGEPDYDGIKQEQAAKGFLQMLMQIFTPQEKPGAMMREGTPEHEFADKDSLTIIRDALRYIGSTPVRVVDTPSRWAKFPVQLVGDEPTRIAGYQPNRKRLTIKNDGTDSVYLGESAEVADGQGYLLEATDDPITIESQDEIWAVCADTESATLYIIGEHYE